MKRRVIEEYQRHEDWLTIPGTKLRYNCVGPNNNENYYFDYSWDNQLPSYYFTKNIKELTITCNEDGYE